VKLRQQRRQIVCCSVTLTVCAALLAGAWSTAAAQESRDDTYLEAYRRAEPITKWPLKKLHHEIPELKGLQPDDDQSKLPAILTGVAESLNAFWKDFADTTSREVIEESRRPEESSSAMGGSIGQQAASLSSGTSVAPVKAQEQFRYLMLVDPDNPDKLREYRTDFQGHESGTEGPSSNFAKTAGFASLPQFLNARLQPLSDFRYLGTQTVDNESTDVVAFAQHVDLAGVRGRFVLGRTSVPILLQGVAWIDAGDHHIIRLRTDLLAPQPDAGLKRVTTVVLFQEVKFQSLKAGLWLPRQVNVALGLDNLTFTNRHLYSDYQLFSVSTDEKKSAPNPPAQNR
jgi:hypothetical protein